MTRTYTTVAALLCALWAPLAYSAAWTATEGELIVNQTDLADFYDHYARNSTNDKLLQDPGGSVAQAGDVRRFGFMLGFEYGLTQRVTADLNVAYFYTQHLNVGENIAFFTSSQPNTQMGLQDFTGHVKFLAWQGAFGGIPEKPSAVLAVAPVLGWQLPLTRYNTALDNPLGDGIVSVDPQLHLSGLFGEHVFVNVEAIYRIREHKEVRVGNVWPKDVVIANPALEQAGVKIGGQIHDQIQAVFELGYLFNEHLSLRVLGKRIETLGGEDLTFEGMPQMMAMGIGKLPMFENSLAYDQDALYVGGGPYFQFNDTWGVGLTYVQAVWFKNFPNVKTGVLSISYNPNFAKTRAREEALLRQKEEQEQEQQEQEAAPEGQTDEQPAPKGQP